MRDIHCHILPGVDDGARDMAESMAMLAAARQAGVTSLVCTPHVRDPYFDYDAMRRAFAAFAAQAQAQGFPVQMGWEVNIAKLLELGMGWIDRLHFDGTDEFLLELTTRFGKSALPEIDRVIWEVQGRGYRVIIAHPERYRLIQDDPQQAFHFIDLGCELQASADFVAGGRLGDSKRPAKRLLKMDAYSYVASDAHCPEHYRLLAKACRKYWA